MPSRSHPLLYSFRRCPYAMRARMALVSAGIQAELIEVALKDKPAELLTLSPKGTVPVLLLPDGRVLDESLAIMDWALSRNDPENWLVPSSGSCLPPGNGLQGRQLIAGNDGDFKASLDRYKYPQRFPGEDCSGARAEGLKFLQKLEQQFGPHPYLMGKHLSYADIAIFPFVRQFANTDFAWFKSQPLPKLQGWLDARVTSPLFLKIMTRNRRWLLDPTPDLQTRGGA